jgi:hypothetical protein
MKTRWALLSTFAVCSLFAANAHAAAVAVMPVQGVNLAEGQCDAIGVFFSNAFARDAHVAVSSPAETKPVWSTLRASLATATRLGATQYVELTAIRLGSKVTLAGILFSDDGKEVYRAEASAPSLDEIDVAASRLARALVWRQPIPTHPAPPQLVDSAPEVPPPLDTTASVSGNNTRNMFGMKGSMSFPAVSGRTFSPQIGFQFDARIGPRSYFMEVGAGVMVPTDDSTTTRNLQLTTGFIELGGSGYLNDGSIGLYIGGGIQPGLWRTESYYYDSSSSYSYRDSRSLSGAMLPLYAQIGLTFTRDIRTRIFAEFRVSQHLLGITDPNDNKNYYPTVMALQMGVGW